MSEQSQMQEDLRYLRVQWDEFIKNGGPRCKAHDEAVRVVWSMKDEWTRAKGMVIAAVILIPAFSGLLALLVVKSDAITVKDIVEQVLAKLANGG